MAIKEASPGGAADRIGRKSQAMKTEGSVAPLGLVDQKYDSEPTAHAVGYFLPPRPGLMVL